MELDFAPSRRDYGVLDVLYFVLRASCTYPSYLRLNVTNVRTHLHGCPCAVGRREVFLGMEKKGGERGGPAG